MKNAARKNQVGLAVIYFATLVSLSACKVANKDPGAADDDGDDVVCTVNCTGGTTAKPITMTEIQPAGGNPVGGTLIEIIGTGFRAISQVYIAGKLCTDFQYISSQKIKCRTPRNEIEERVDVEIFDIPASGTGAKRYFYTDAYNYTSVAAPTILSPTGNTCDVAGSVNLGCTLVIFGSGFKTGAYVTVDGVRCLASNVNGDQSISCDVPPGYKGLVKIKVVNPNGLTAELANGFTYTGVASFSRIQASLQSCQSCHNFLSNYAVMSGSGRLAPSGVGSIWHHIGVLQPGDEDFMGGYISAKDNKQFKDWLDSGAPNN